MTTSFGLATVPTSGVCSAEMISSSVALPAPLGPTSAIRSRPPTDSDASEKRTRSPNDFVMHEMLTDMPHSLPALGHGRHGDTRYDEFLRADWTSRSTSAPTRIR